MRKLYNFSVSNNVYAIQYIYKLTEDSMQNIKIIVKVNFLFDFFGVIIYNYYVDN